MGPRNKIHAPSGLQVKTLPVISISFRFIVLRVKSGAATTARVLVVAPVSIMPTNSSVVGDHSPSLNTGAIGLPSASAQTICGSRVEVGLDVTVTVRVIVGGRVRVAVGPLMGDGVSDGAGARVAERACVIITVGGWVGAGVEVGAGGSVEVTAGLPLQAGRHSR